MQSNNTLKIIIVVALVAVILLMIGLAINSGNTDRMSGTEYQNSMIQGGEELNTINASSTYEADMDAYIKAADNPSNPNDFNDSYSDLNR